MRQGPSKKMKPDYRDAPPLEDEADEPQEELPETREQVVGKDQHGQRLDKVLVTLAPEFSRNHLQGLVEAGHVYVAMPPLYRIDIGKEVYYALDEAEKQARLDLIAAEKKRGTVAVTRFKGLGEMNPLQLRETTISPDTRRLVKLTIDDAPATDAIMDMMLAKKRASDRKQWLEDKGNLASV